MLGGGGGLLFPQFWKRGSSPQGQPPSPETEVQGPWDKADNASVPSSWLLPILRPIPLAQGGIRSAPRKQLPGDTGLRLISHSRGVLSPFSPE